ncbi:hypothetical protein DZF91_20100 [Actinomadura logoneensis]|uniref:Uncharacterized protein n=1 Tax=Actinomadura logoneensis TaxID=2293572 RepID=A0A372JIN3_9ACTN|nr:hypothetical protein [Actinomadura logoneensis]RFU39871.1 hypothetical protein DZF91_20100 [Actinomadura logoneensis]
MIGLVFTVLADPGWQDVGAGCPRCASSWLLQASGTWCFDVGVRDWATRDANGGRPGDPRWRGPTTQDDTAYRFRGPGGRRGQLIGRWGEDGRPFPIGDHAVLGRVGPLPYVPPEAEGLRARIGLVHLLADPDSAVTGDRSLRELKMIGCRYETRRMRDVVESGREEWRARYGLHMPVPEVWLHAHRAVKRAELRVRMWGDEPASYAGWEREEPVASFDPAFLYGAPLRLVSDRPHRPPHPPAAPFTPGIVESYGEGRTWFELLPELDPDPTRAEAKFPLRCGLPWLTQRRIARLDACRDPEGRPWRDPEHVAWVERFIADMKTVQGPWTMLTGIRPVDGLDAALRLSDVVPDLVEIAAKPAIERREALERMIADEGFPGPSPSAHRCGESLWLAMNDIPDGAARSDGRLRVVFD